MTKETRTEAERPDTRVGTFIATHGGRIRGCDARTPPGYQRWVGLRETAKYWITAYRQKYRKIDGLPAGAYRGRGDYPLYALDLATIRPLRREATDTASDNPGSGK